MQAPAQNENLIRQDQRQELGNQPAASFQVGLPSYFEMKLNKAMGFKNQGNNAFKNHYYQQARAKYQQALQLLQPVSFTGASQIQCNRNAELSANLLFNLGTCFFNENKWREGELMYNQAITINPYYVKAIYKRALCRHHLNKYEEAMEDIKQAHNFDKSNEDIRQAYELIREKYNEELRKDNQKRKQLSSKIFNPDKSPSKKEKEKEAKQKPGKEQKGGSGWWMLSLVPLAAAALYQGIKYLRS